jgi:parallel beta-helix repeat protein
MAGTEDARRLPRRGRLARDAFIFAGALAVVLGSSAAGNLASAAVDLAADSSSSSCQEDIVTSVANADAWIDENSPSTAKGSDSVLNVDAGSANVDTGLVSGRARALVRFPLPSAVPPGCVVESAMLRLFSTEESVGTRVEAVRLASSWSEDRVTWSGQPGTTGAAVRIWSREGYMRWNVTSQVEAMLGGTNQGFLIRDAAEGAETGGGGHGFYSKEKGEAPPELVIRFAAPPSDDPPGAPAPPAPASVVCGQVLTQSTLVTNDLSDCPGDGLVIGSDRIIVDLDGHLIDGVGLGSGILNDGYDLVTIKNGTVQQFDYGVQLLPETELNAVERLTLRLNEVAAVELFDVADGEIRGNTLDQNGGGISLVSGTRGVLVADNAVSANGGAGLLIRDSDGNRLENNTVGGGGDLGIGLERASGNTLFGNTVSNNSDGGIEIRAGSHGNHVENSTVTESGDHGILVHESDRNELISNTAHLMSDSGITLESAHDGVVRGSDVRFNTGGLQLDGSSRNLLESNNASSTSGIGIELGGGSLENDVVLNTAIENGAQGIYVADDATDGLGNPLSELGNLLLRNTASGNLSDGIVVAKGGHTVTANIADDNRGWGINAGLASIDGSGNVATGNLKPEQCVGVVCKEEWNPPETMITDHPADPTNSTSVTIAFVGTDDTSPPSGLRFECSVDEAPFAPCTSPAEYGGLGEGAHTFTVVATDRAGNVDPTPASSTWTIDTTPPETTITDRPADLTRSTSATFGFSADEPGSTFQCSLDNEPFTSCAAPAEYGGLGEGAHTLRVMATDRAGNTDPTPATHAWTIDTTPPETTIDSGPADPTTAASATFTFSSEPGSTLQCSLDAAAFATCTSPAEYHGLDEGVHTFEVRAADRAGNTDPTPASFTWAIDSTAPETTISARPEDPTKNTSATFGFAADEPASTFQCSLDEGRFEPCTSPASYTGLSEGAHTFEVRATDRAGNTDPTPATHTWTVDTAAPETTIDDGPADPTNSTSATLRFSSEPGSTFQCSLDTAAFAACTSPAEYSGLSEGSHTFRVKATDRAGNTDPTPASFTWAIDSTAPETTITDRPEDPTKNTSATFGFAADEPASTFQCFLDEGRFEPCTSPASYTGLSEGAHTFEVRATDRAGNTDPTPATHTWTVDTTAPETTIEDGPADPTSSPSATLRFSSEPGSSFQCSLDAAAFAACDSPASYTGLSEGAHTFEVRATDRAGNTDPTPATHNWTVDTTPPQTTIDSAPAALTNSTSAMFTFSGTEAGSFECRLDGQDPAPWSPCSSPQSYTDLAEGSHTFEVRATDRAGNTDPTPAAHTWTVDTTAPETTIDSGPDDPTNSTAPRFTFTGSDNATAPPELAFECRLDSQAEADFVECSSPQSYTNLTEGSHTFEARATDRAGNVESTPATYTWTVDTTAPETTIVDGPADPTSSTSATLRFSGEPGSSFACSLDAAAFAACTSPASNTGLSQGAHTFEVRATDRAGNTDPTPATHTWTVDTTAPETTIDDGPADPTNSTSATFAFSATESGSTFACSLDGAAFTACTSPRQYTGLAQGSHTFQVRATDRAGNTDPTPATHTWTIQAADTTPPQTTIDSGPAALTNSSSATFTFSATESGSTFACSLDGAAFTACTSPRQYTGLSQGSHTFQVRATDRAGNTDPTPATHTWTVSASSACPSPTTASAAEDAWIDQNSPTNNKGTDSILKVQSKGPADNFRALVRFTLPTTPEGCVLDTAELRLYASSASGSQRTLEVLRLGGSWTEGGVTWANAPQTSGSAVTTTSGSGYREWDVATLVQSMYSSGSNHGFLIKDATEGQDAEQQFHAREKGNNVPQLVLTFKPAS